MIASRARVWFERVWPLLVLSAVCALFFWRFFAPELRDRVAYEAGDFTETFYGFHKQTYAAFVAGRWADWADCLWSGYPLGADPQAQLLYPPKWLTFLILRTQGYGHFPLAALTGEIAAHYGLLSSGMYIWLRALKLRRGAALVGAVTFAYGGYAMGYAPLQSAVLMTTTWLPWILWGLTRLARSGAFRDLALTALAAALAFYAGHPQTFLHGAVLTAAYAAFLAVQARLGWRRSLALGASLAALIVGLSVAQLAPMIGFNLASTRASISYAEASGGFPLVDPLQMILTGVVSHWHPLFVGLLPLSLVVFGLGRPDRERVFWVAIAAVGLLVSFGESAGWAGAFFNLVPGWDLFRGQERLALWVSLALATLAAFGTHDALGPLERTARLRLKHDTPRSVALWAGFGLLALAAVIVARLDLDNTDWRALPDRAGVMWLGAGLALAFWLLRTYWMRWARSALPILVVIGLATELYAANGPLNRVPAYEATPPRALLEPILQSRATAPERFFRVVDDQGLPGHVGCLYGFSHIDGRTPIKLATYAAFRERLPERVQWLLLGVGFVVSGRDAIDDRSAVAVAEEAGTRTFQLTTVPQRAWLSHTTVSAPDPEAVLAMLHEAADLFGTAWLVGDAPAVAPATGSESVAIESERPGALVLTVEASAPAVLTVSEAYAPGWAATVNGEPAKVQISAGALLGVAVPAGPSHVVLTYSPVELLPARLASALTLAGALALLAFGRRRAVP